MFYMFYSPLTYTALIFFAVQPTQMESIGENKFTPLRAFPLALLKFECSPWLAPNVFRNDSPILWQMFMFRGKNYETRYFFGKTFSTKKMCPSYSQAQEVKHCQRHNGPEGWVLLTKVQASSNTNLGQISSSESQPNINQTSVTQLKLEFKIIDLYSTSQPLQNLSV